MRALGLVAAVALLIGLFVLLRPEEKREAARPEPQTQQEKTSKPQFEELSFTVQGGKITALGSLSTTQGRAVVIRVTADVADQVHLHGYDLSKPVAPGQPAELRFTAATAGRFELELENSGKSLGFLEVQPK